MWNITHTTRKSAAGIADIENRLVNTVRGLQRAAAYMEMGRP